MPPTHFTRVDLPAPLSPTSAMTSPRKTLKSTLCSTWIAPKLLLIPRRARMGESATVSLSLGAPDEPRSMDEPTVGSNLDVSTNDRGKNGRRQDRPPNM